MSETELLVPENGTSTEMTRFNALKHGILSRYTVLPWEDRSEYDTLVTSLLIEHGPRGPTEEHLVEELAGILWRKRRLRLAEAATHRRGLNDTLEPHRKTIKAALVHLDVGEPVEQVVEVIRATEADTAEEVRDMLDDEAVTRRALDLLSSRRNDAYEAALAALREDTQTWWADTLDCDPDELEEDEQPATPDAEGLRRFIENQVLPWFETRKKELTNRPLIREQAFGEALDPDKLQRLGRYEVHLDRKFERTLTILLRLKDLRHHAISG
jgi:hypothetical protein